MWLGGESSNISIYQSGVGNSRVQEKGKTSVGRGDKGSKKRDVGTRQAPTETKSRYSRGDKKDR